LDYAQRDDSTLRELPRSVLFFLFGDQMQCAGARKVMRKRS